MPDSPVDGHKMVFEKTPAGRSAQINCSRARIASSRIICDQTKELIRETKETINRSLEKLDSKPETDPWQFTGSNHRPS
jgi:hypothetical protein